MVTLFDIVVFEGTYLVKLLTDCYEDVLLRNYLLPYCFVLIFS